jgi:hypothetical protein
MLFLCAHPTFGWLFLYLERDGTKGPPIGIRIGPTLIISVTKFNQNAEFLAGSQAHLFLPAAVLVEFLGGFPPLCGCARALLSQ